MPTRRNNVEVARTTGAGVLRAANRQSGRRLAVESSDSWHRLCEDDAEAVTIARRAGLHACALNLPHCHGMQPEWV